MLILLLIFLFDFWIYSSLWNTIFKKYRMSQKNETLLLLNILATTDRIFKLFFLLKTEIHRRILNTKPFLCDIRGPRYLQNKIQFWNILCHSGLKPAKLAPSSANWPKTVLVAPKWLLVGRVTQTDWINVITVFYLYHFQNIWEL